jgi:hypothetical protein
MKQDEWAGQRLSPPRSEVVYQATARLVNTLSWRSSPLVEQPNPRGGTGSGKCRHQRLHVPLSTSHTPDAQSSPVVHGAQTC